MRLAVVRGNDLPADGRLEVGRGCLRHQQLRQKPGVVQTHGLGCRPVLWSIELGEALRDPAELQQGLHHTVIEAVLLEEAEVVEVVPDACRHVGLGHVLGPSVEQEEDHRVDLLPALLRHEEGARELVEREALAQQEAIDTVAEEARHPRNPGVDHRVALIVHAPAGLRAHRRQDVHGLRVHAHVLRDLREDLGVGQGVLLLQHGEDGLQERPGLRLGRRPPQRQRAGIWR
mmetsp:Transcript_65949/g.204586  ORF Transcript_65949/g.204586 Transcript_65949/m.204586 type:complete len:231 (-) Transcript_65949:554-1246(-)